MLDVTPWPCLCLSAGVKVEPVHEEAKAKYNIWKPFIFRGKVWGERKKILGFFMACLTFAFLCRWKTKSPRRAAETPPLGLDPPHLSHLPSLRRGIDRAPSHRPRTLSKTQPTLWRRTAMYNPSLTAGVRGGKKKHALHRIYFFMQPVYKSHLVLRKRNTFL